MIEKGGQTNLNIVLERMITLTRKSLYFFVLILSLLILATGCGYERYGSNRNPNNPDNTSPQVQAKRNNIADQMITNPADIAAHLENIATRVPHVRGAHCVVLGNTAVVGIDVESDLERSKVGTIKYSVAEALRKDPYGVNSIVTADLDINQRLREIRESVMAGRPFAGFASEMADIVSRIMPQLPGDLIQGGDMVQDNAGNSGAGNSENNTMRHDQMQREISGNNTPAKDLQKHLQQNQR